MAGLRFQGEVDRSKEDGDSLLEHEPEANGKSEDLISL